jgi:hypothetical protein
VREKPCGTVIIAGFNPIRIERMRFAGAFIPLFNPIPKQAILSAIRDSTAYRPILFFILSHERALTCPVLHNKCPLFLILAVMQANEGHIPGRE